MSVAASTLTAQEQARRIRAARAWGRPDGRPITQAELAASLGVARMTVNRWESGEAALSPLTWYGVVQYLRQQTGLPAPFFEGGAA